MIGYLSSIGNKRTAWFLLFLFYFQMLASAYTEKKMGLSGVRITIPNYPAYLNTGISNAGNHTHVFNGNTSSGVSSRPSNETSETKVKSPLTVSIGGPGQPEMTSFKSVGADNMVNLFTGDFSYNIPLLDAGGYPINMFYNGGISMDQDATWVGLGWNINPGTITRNMRGLPDDFNGGIANGDVITKTQSIKDDITVGVNVGLNTEIKGMPLAIGANAGVFWNNRRGVGLELGGNFSVQTSIAKKSGTEKTAKDSVPPLPANLQGSLGGGFNLNSQNGMSLNAGFDVTMTNNDKDIKTGLSTSIDYMSRTGLNTLKIESENTIYGKTEAGKPISDQGVYGSHISFARSSFTPGIRMPVSRYNGNLKIKIGGAFIVTHGNGFVSGSLSRTYIAEADKKQEKPAFGYMYSEKANDNKNALMDFNRINDGTYTLKSAVISVPNYTYDVFNISGEGTGGSFRGYRSNMGFTRDNYTKSREGSVSLSFDAGGGNLFHGGTELGGVYSVTEVGDWVTNNALRNTVGFTETDSNYSSFYFKNPGEKAIIDEDYYNTIGKELLVRPKLTGTSLPLPIVASKFEAFDSSKRFKEDLLLTTENAIRKKRDKRTQVITYLTAEEADKVALDKRIYSYTENSFSPGNCPTNASRTAIRRYQPNSTTEYRKAHHLSEIDVLEADGKRYIYGIPAYTRSQKDVSFSIAETRGDTTTQLTDYSSRENSTENNSGRDGYYQSEEIPAYAHSFLLTAILSPDYVDKTDDGITDDDLGTAVKFNYTRVNKYGSNSWLFQRWRTPMENGKAHFNEGLKTDNKDNKALYTYGEKELWYTHSIETKNMYVTFTLEDRHDGKMSASEAGGISSAGGQKKLSRIDLYTKASFLKPNPKPVKSVHFAYSYSLCKGVPHNFNGAEGKLTLDSIWFSYNGNYKQTKNKYRFKYASSRDDINGNPDYNSTQTDRWGTYKNNTVNPAGMRNADFPYSLQDYSDTLAGNVYAGAWGLEKIMIPSGAVINVTYEADDYAYVQNKRAAQMTQVAGFAKDSVSLPTNELYKYSATPFSNNNPGKMDYRFVFFDVAESVTSKEDIQRKYLEGMKQLLMKLWVQMPTTLSGGGYEPINIYANIENCGLVIGNTKRFWVKLAETSKGGSPIMETVLQFLKDNLPSKVYKGYEHGGEPALKQIVYAIQGLGDGFIKEIAGFENNLKSRGIAKIVNTSYSFARLNNPLYTKKGGGHRVKAVVISDNWKKMIDPDNPTQLESFYGQTYDYTTTEIINGAPMQISSGVATYEPGIGNEENPFREVLQYHDKQPLGPTNVTNLELPITETFFPSPSVGYGKVTVRSIHHKTIKNIKSNTGKQVTEFYTAKDFPLLSDYTDFDSRSRVHYKPNGIMKILFQQNTDFLTLSQGFRVILNDMHGKIKSQSSFAESDMQTPINQTVYHYRMKNSTGNTYRLDNKLKVISNAEGKTEDRLIGKDVEIMNDFRDHYASTRSGQVPLNVDVWSIPFIPGILAWPAKLKAFFKDESIYRSATTLKIIQEYGILDSVVNIDKGSEVSTKNMVYDGETGEVLITRTSNNFNKPVYNLNYPAHWVNSGMDMAYKNIDLTYKNVNFLNGKIENSPHVNQLNFESGDEIFILNPKLTLMANNPVCAAVGAGPAVLLTNTSARIWALDVRKDERNTQREIIFIDRFGTPYNATNVNIRVIRSGKRNMIAASVGSVTSLKNPLSIINGAERIAVSNNTDVLNAAAVEFKEHWRAQDAFYSVDSTITAKRYMPIDTFFAYPENNYSISRFKPSRNGTSYRTHHLPDADFFMARQQSSGRKPSRSRRQDGSWILFNVGSLSDPDVRIKSATLQLFAHTSCVTSFRHDFEYRDGGQPFFDGLHTRFNSHSRKDATNEFKLTRMLRTWPTTLAAWEAEFNNSGTGYYNEVIVNQPTANPSYQNYTGSAIDIKGIFEGMLRDKNDPQKQYSPALKIRMIEFNADHDSRVCFHLSSNLTRLAGDSGDVSNATAPGCTTAPGQPYILVRYSSCNNVYGPEYTPTYPAQVDSCMTSTTATYCFSVFDRKQMNPYVHGVLGIFRSWRSYAFYGERKGADPATATNIATDGVIDSFVTFWTPGADYMQKTISSKWVWNSEITQYNRKGLEIENRDPLQRYNSGVYGYQETLPVAVANNARVREIAFDGFEDYTYKDQPCEPFCKPNKRHFTTGNITPHLNDKQYHTGSYSVKIPSGNLTFTSPVLPNDTVVRPDVRIKINSVSYIDTSVSLLGTGLKRTVYVNTNFSGTSLTLKPSMVNLGPEAINCTPLGHGNNPFNTFLNPVCNKFSIRWEGRLQADQSGPHSFWLSQYLDDQGSIEIRRANDNVLIYSFAATGNNNPIPATQVSLIKGQVYNIKVDFVNSKTYYGVQLQWKKPGAQAFAPVPSANLYYDDIYSLATSTPGGINYCVTPDTIQSVKHHLIDSFSLIANRKYVFSAWVKEGSADCMCTDYIDNAVDIRVNGNSILTGDAKPSGNIIEGWQRFEFEFTIPGNAQSLQILLKKSGSKDVYFDDLRIFPFNGNMKSFVYHPDNLRLQAELDENNYASLYEYDDDGTLIRVKKETKEGIKTITETRSALQKSLPGF